MNRLLLIVCLIVFKGLIQAQENANQTFTLQQCIEYALQNQTAMKNAKLDEEIANARIAEIRGKGLPQLNGSVQAVNNNPLRRMFMAASDQNPFTQSLPFPIENGSIIAMNNFFQLPSSGEANVSASQLIFNGSYLVGIQATKTYKELAVKGTEMNTIKVIEQIQKAYYSVIISRERMKLFDINIARVDSFHRYTKALYEAGFVEKLDVDRIEVSLNNLLTEKENFNNLFELSKELLKFQMNYPMDKNLEVAGSVADIEHNINFVIDKTITNKRIEISLLETQIKLQKLDLKNYYSTFFPTISAFGTLGYSTQSNNIKGLFMTNTKGIPENTMVGPDKWYRHSILGLNIIIPIFDGFQTSNKIKQAQFNIQKLENQYSTLQQGQLLELSQAEIILKNNLKSLENQKKTMDLSQEIARITKIKYSEGVGSNLEVINAEASLKETQINYYNALYNVVIAKIDLQKALGTLSNTTNNK